MLYDGNGEISSKIPILLCFIRFLLNLLWSRVLSITFPK